MERSKKRVVITGMATINPLDNDIDTFYEKLCQGESSIGPITKFSVEDYPTRFGGSVDEEKIKEFALKYYDRKAVQRIDPNILYTLVAGKMALENAGLLEDYKKLDGKRCGILVGSGMGGMDVFCEGVRTLENKGHKRVTPFFVPYIITNMGPALLAKELGFNGPNYSISTACATGNYAILAAVRHIQNNEGDLFLCGGSEAAMIEMGLAGFVACKAMSTRNDSPQTASRPWDVTRDGFVMSEGAAVLCIESLEHAQKRGANIIAEVCGGAINCDAYHMTSPHPDGDNVAHCMELAIEDAGIDKNEINYINAHATSTPVGDLCEVRALKKVFSEEQRKNLSVNATKSLIGHSLGAASAIEAIVVAKAIQEKRLHPTINCKEQEEESKEFDLVLDHQKPKEVKYALSNSFGFGGHNSTLVLGYYQS